MFLHRRWFNYKYVIKELTYVAEPFAQFVSDHYNTSVGIQQLVVPHAEFVLQDATPRTFASMYIILTINVHDQAHDAIFNFP